MTSFLCFYCYLLADFTYCYGVSTVDFEELNTGCEGVSIQNGLSVIIM